MTVENLVPASGGADRGVAVLGTAASLGALFSAAACCVLPLALGAIGLGAGGLAAVVPLRWPLTIAAIAAVAAGWLLHVRKKRACARDASCTAPSRATFAMLCLAMAFVTISALWSFVETPLMKLLGGA